MIRKEFLVYQAKSFYNAFIALEQVHQASDDELLYLIPILVNGAFSIEISLKAILANNGIEYGKEHNLLVLFQLLPDVFQDELLGHLIEKAPEYNNPDKFSEEMVLISYAFVDWRYAFEGEPAPAFESRFLSAFANASIWTMISHYDVDLVPATTVTTTDEEVDEMIRKNREQCIETNLLKIQQKQKKNRDKIARIADKE